MGRKPDLSVKEKEYVTRALASRESTLQISKDMQRDHRTVEKIVAASHHARKKRVQPKIRKLTQGRSKFDNWAGLIFVYIRVLHN